MLVLANWPYPTCIFVGRFVACFFTGFNHHAANKPEFIIYTGMADLSDTSRWWFNCVSVSLCVLSESVCPKTCCHIARRMMNG